MTFNTVLKDNKQHVLKAIKCGIDCLQFASNRLQKDEEIVSEAIKLYSDCFKYASDEIKNDPKFILKVVNKNMYILPHISDKLKEDPEFILCVLEKLSTPETWQYLDFYKYILCHISDKLKEDKEFILCVLEKFSKGDPWRYFDFCKYVLCYISDKLKNDEDFLLKFVKKNIYIFEYLPITLRENRNFILEGLKQGLWFLRHVSDKLLNKEGIILLSIKYGFCRSWTCGSTIYLGKTETEWSGYFCDLYKKSYAELNIILRESKLTLSDAGAKVFTVNKEFDKNTNSYIINMLAMDGNEYTISNITSDITVNELANKLYHLNNSHNNIVFINEKGETFDLSNFNENIIDLI